MREKEFAFHGRLLGREIATARRYRGVSDGCLFS